MFLRPHLSPTFRRTKNATLAFFILYFLVAGAGHVYAPKREYFPVFSWSLFSTSPDELSDIEIDIVAVDDRRFEPPRDFFELPALFSAARQRSTNATKAARALADLVSDGSSDVAAAQASFERAYLGGHRHVEYRLVKRKFNPLRRYKTGEILEEEVVFQGVLGKAGN